MLQTKQSKAKQSKAKQSKTKQSKAKQSKAKQSKANKAKQSEAKQIMGGYCLLYASLYFTLSLHCSYHFKSTSGQRTAAHINVNLIVKEVIKILALAGSSFLLYV